MADQIEQKKFNHEFSQYLHDRIEAEPGCCFLNAVKALEFSPKAEYVEGYVVSPNTTKPFLHGWLELEEEIIDPTLPDGNRKYFPGGRRTEAEYLKFSQEVEALKAKESSTLLEYHLEPDYHNKLVCRMRINKETPHNEPPEFEQARRQALAYKEGQQH